MHPYGIPLHFAWLLWLLASALRAADRPIEHPHVLFIAVDDMKDWVGCLGGYEGVVSTPNIDRLAQQGTLFTNAHCPSPKCAPSRAAILTGRMPSSTGLYDNSHWWFPNAQGLPTIPVYFRKHGYHTAGAGKIFHHTAGNHPPNQWNEFQPLRFRNDPWFRGSRLNYPWSAHAPPPEAFPWSGIEGLGHENDWGSLPINERDYDDARTVDFAIRFLERTHQTPFFLACGLFRPHLPWYVPSKYFEQYPLESVRLPPQTLDDLGDVPPAGRIFAEARQQDLDIIRGRGRWRQAVQAYLASISYADAQLGRLLNALSESPYDGQTIVVLWSDHGWHLGEKDHWHKSTLWEEATRVPLIIRTPGAAASKCARPVSLIDIYPTLLELCQLPPVKTLDGRSLLPQIRNPHAPRERPAITEFRQGNASVRTDRYRYIRYRDGGVELYDHHTDPHEWHNLADVAEHAHRKASLERWLPQRWAPPADTKQAFHFDAKTFTWTHLESGRISQGQ